MVPLQRNLKWKGVLDTEILFLQALQVIVRDAWEKRVFKGLSLNRDRANISLLQYADDALFFGGEWSSLNVSNLLCILECFRKASGLKVNIF